MFKRGLIREGALIRGGALFDLAKHINQKMISIIDKELERKVAKLKHMKLEVMQPKIKNKSELQARV